MGIENYNFLLRLDNPALMYVDPHDPNIDLNTKIAILNEVSKNPWYAVRECIRIPTGGGLEMFKAHRANIAILWAHFLNFNTLIMLPRQANKTTTVLTAYAIDCLFMTFNTEFALYGLKESQLKDNMERFKNLRDGLPSFMQLRSNKDRENISEMRINFDMGKYNRLGYVVSATSEDKAKSVSRGSSKARMMRDEFAFSPFIRIEYANSVYAFLTVAAKARENHSSYGITMLTTAGFLNEDCGKWAFNKFNESAPFDESLYDKTYVAPNGDIRFDRPAIMDYMMANSVLSKQDANEKIEQSEFSTFLKITFQWYEMGYDQEWINTMRSSSDTEDDFRREVLCEWQDSTTNHPYGQDRIRQLQSHKRKPVETITINNLYILRIYREMTTEDWKMPLILGMDVGSNTGSDFSTLVALDPTNFEVVATLRTNGSSAPKFARGVAYVMEHIFPNSILVPERNSLGSIVIQYIVECIESVAEERVYKESSMKFGDINKEKPYGVHLTKDLRDLFFNDILRNAIVNEVDKIHDDNIIEEITGLRFTKAGRIDHQDGGHDDTLIGYLYTRWFLQYCTNRNKYIDPVIIGSRKWESKAPSLVDIINNNTKGNDMYNMKKIMGFGGSHEYERKTPAEIQKEQLDLVNKNNRVKRYTEDEWLQIDSGMDTRDIFMDRIAKKYKDTSQKDDMEQPSEYRTKEDLTSTYSKNMLEVEPEALEKSLKSRKEVEEMSEEAMRNSMASFFQ